jgi:hypothetical protein
MSGAVISTAEVPPEVKAMLCARGDAARTESEISLMCEGVVPQQPPMNFAPAWMNRLANFRHVLRRAHVKLSSLHVAREACVGLR